MFKYLRLYFLDVLIVVKCATHLWILSFALDELKGISRAISESLNLFFVCSSWEALNYRLNLELFVDREMRLEMLHLIDEFLLIFVHLSEFVY
jgi:hypothetical protein